MRKGINGVVARGGPVIVGEETAVQVVFEFEVNS